MRTAEQRPTQHPTDPDPPRHNRQVRVGVFAFWLAWTLLAGAALTGCAAGPETLPTQMHAALAAGDGDAVRALLTVESRALLDTLQDAPHPEGRWPFGLHAPTRPTEVLDVQRPDDSTAVVRLRDGELQGEWVLRREAGSWRLDLAASASRRPFLGL